MNMTMMNEIREGLKAIAILQAELVELTKTVKELKKPARKKAATNKGTKANGKEE